MARFSLDFIIFDILTIPDAMGLGLYFAEGEGPKNSSAPLRRMEIGRPRCPIPTYPRVGRGLPDT
jgi:uroporphyrinogen decarboxylase